MIALCARNADDAHAPGRMAWHVIVLAATSVLHALPIAAHGVGACVSRSAAAAVRACSSLQELHLCSSGISVGPALALDGSPEQRAVLEMARCAVAASVLLRNPCFPAQKLLLVDIYWH